MAFKAIPFIKVKETEIAAVPVVKKTAETKLIIEEPEPPVNKKTVAQTAPVAAEPKRSLGSLDAIRKKVSAQNKANGNDVKELTTEELKFCWDKFIEKLNEKKNHSAVTNFKGAILRIIDNNSIEIITESNIQQKFIEQERAELVHFLQDHFCNRQLTYSVIITEKEDAAQSGERPLNTREQYQKLIEEYPLVKELKDRLRLELDY